MALSALGAGLIVVIVVAWARGDLRSYGDELGRYLDAVERHDPAAASDHVCASLAADLRADPQRWTAALVEQDAALGGVLGFNPHRGSSEEASFEVQLRSGRALELTMPIADEDGRLLPCPRLDALFGGRS